MRVFRTSAAVLLLAAGPLFAADAKNCLDLSARIDNDISSPSGVRVTIYGHNHCSEDLDGNEARFKVMAIGAGGAVIATQNGRFGGTVAPGGQVETRCSSRAIRSGSDPSGSTRDDPAGKVDSRVTKLVLQQNSCDTPGRKVQ